jgi:hypothetical protein
MTQLLLFIAVGVGLLVLLLVGMRRSPAAAEGSAGALVAAKRTLESLQLGLLPAELVERVFGRQDFAYIASIGSTELSNLFMAERKRLALAWIRQVRNQIRALREFHISRSRMFAHMSRWMELSLALDFAELEFQCRVLQLLMQWRGPYAAPNFARRMAATAGRLCAVLDQSLAFLTPAIPASLGSESGLDGTTL